jgi:hypothetical protein
VSARQSRDPGVNLLGLGESPIVVVPTSPALTRLSSGGPGQAAEATTLVPSRRPTSACFLSADHSKSRLQTSSGSCTVSSLSALHVQGLGRVDARDRWPCRRGECRAQRFVALHDRGEALRERCAIQLPPQSQQDEKVGEGLPWVQLVEEPEALLGGG